MLWKKKFTIVTPEQIFGDIIGVTSFIVSFSFETKIMYQVISKSSSFAITVLYRIDVRSIQFFFSFISFLK